MRTLVAIAMLFVVLLQSANSIAADKHDKHEHERDHKEFRFYFGTPQPRYYYEPRYYPPPRYYVEPPRYYVPPRYVYPEPYRYYRGYNDNGGFGFEYRRRD